MLRQSRRPQYEGILVLAVAVAGLAACSGTPASPTASPTTADSRAYTALSQNPRFAQVTPVPAAPQRMSPEEALAAAPFAFNLPAWTPPGFALQPQADVITPSTTAGLASVSLNWQNAQGATIELLISRGAAASGLAAAGANTETLQIGGQPASLRRQTGFGPGRLSLSWSSASLTYRLTAEDGAATRDELVRMAESIA